MRGGERTGVPTDLQPVEIPESWLAVLEAFDRRGVQYLVAGSAADAIVERNPPSAHALVLAPAPFRRNLERVAAALGDLGAQLRSNDGAGHPVDLTRVPNHPTVRWRLLAAGTPLDVIGSAVGDGEFSIRVWRTRAVTLTACGRSVSAEVEFTAEFAAVS